MHRVLVCGGRNYSDDNRVHEILNSLKVRPNFIIQGGASGADALAYLWAKEKGVEVVTVHALWDFHGKKAGALRNEAMLNLCKINLVVAFPGGTGTADMVRRARRRGIKVREIR